MKVYRRTYKNRHKMVSL